MFTTSFPELINVGIQKNVYNIFPSIKYLKQTKRLNLNIK